MSRKEKHKQTGTNSHQSDSASLASSLIAVAKQEANEFKDDVKTLAEEAKESAQEEAVDFLDKSKNTIASEIKMLGDGLKEIAEQYPAAGAGLVPQCFDFLAGTLHEIHTYVDNESPSSLIRSSKTFMKKNPEVTLAASFIGGVLASRFFKARSRNNVSEDEVDEIEHELEDELAKGDAFKTVRSNASSTQH